MYVEDYVNLYVLIILAFGNYMIKIECLLVDIPYSDNINPITLRYSIGIVFCSDNVNSIIRRYLNKNIRSRKKLCLFL